MIITDPIADLLARIRNGLMRRKDVISVPHSRLKEAIANLLISEGYITSSEVVAVDGHKNINLQLKYAANHLPVISGMERVSKPGQRIYSSSNHLTKVLAGYGVSVLSTSRGLMTDAQAKEAKIGGEVLFKIW